MINLSLVLLATLATLARAFATIIISIVSGWFLGYIAIKNKTFENIYISISEVLESVPVISFFPIVLIFFVFTIGGQIGIESAVLFLIFTAVVWNIWMGIYQAFKTVPENLQEVSQNYRLSFLSKMSKLYIPFSIPRIAANLLPSFADALFYITVSEVFTVGTHQYQVFGIGALISIYTAEGDYTDALISIGVLAIFVTIVVLLLREYAEYSVRKYGLDTEDKPTLFRRGRPRVRYSARLNAAKSTFTKLSKYIARPPYLMKRRLDTEEEEKRKKKIPTRLITTLLGSIILILIGYSVFNTVTHVPISVWKNLLSGTGNDLILIGYDYIRVAIIALVSFVIAIFLGYYIATRPLADRVAVPIMLTIASFPAPAYFPLLYLATFNIVSSVFGPFTNEFYVLLLGFLSTFYYIFYNFWLGVKNLPSEYWEVMKNTKLGFGTRMRKIILPATFPYIISGISSTINSAWGGLAIGEYWPNIVNGKTLEVQHGLMKALAVADNQGNLALVGWLSLLFAIIVVIYSIVFTRRMMDIARKKYVAEEGIYAA
ncbi:ABC transporter permease subunit [Acidianus sulfidivorans JP7]|uniref:Sugar ABC transporter permease n=1 Tax=Acidianus sulfidivorans JP7 TaxID=619593 RepID=A0A2U9IK49_9CREN|nr:ABC transporter permease subunit [Acidianus sulfidivorans]AWR96411.1 ABC transporter permease subunit [Acidianus sulfidivorans JP7]